MILRERVGGGGRAKAALLAAADDLRRDFTASAACMGYRDGDGLLEVAESFLGTMGGDMRLASAGMPVAVGDEEAFRAAAWLLDAVMAGGGSSNAICRAARFLQPS